MAFWGLRLVFRGLVTVRCWLCCIYMGSCRQQGDTSWPAWEKTNSQSEWQDSKTKQAWRCVAIVFFVHKEWNKIYQIDYFTPNSHENRAVGSKHHIPLQKKNKTKSKKHGWKTGISVSSMCHHPRTRKKTDKMGSVDSRGVLGSRFLCVHCPLMGRGSWLSW